MWHKAQNFADFLEYNREYNSYNVDYNQWEDPFNGPLDVNHETQERIDRLGVFVFSFGEFFATDYGSWRRSYISFWCPERTEPLKLISKLQERSDVIVYAIELHPFRVVQGTRAEPMDFEKRRGKIRQIGPFNIGKDTKFWKLENVRREKPWVIDVVAKSLHDLDLIRVMEESINQCGWRK